jgi:hypothetical protein
MAVDANAPVRSLELFGNEGAGMLSLYAARIEDLGRRVTITTSPASSWSSKRRSCARSVLAPLATSRNTLNAYLVRAGFACLRHELVSLAFIAVLMAGYSADRL